MICLSQNLPEFWKPQKELLGTKESKCAKFSGSIIQRKKPLGKERMI